MATAPPRRASAPTRATPGRTCSHACTAGASTAHTAIYVWGPKFDHNEPYLCLTDDSSHTYANALANAVWGGTLAEAIALCDSDVLCIFVLDVHDDDHNWRACKYVTEAPAGEGVTKVRRIGGCLPRALARLLLRACFLMLRTPLCVGSKRSLAVAPPPCPLVPRWFLARVACGHRAGHAHPASDAATYVDGPVAHN